MSTYQDKKEAARDEAIEWQIYATENDMSYGELFWWQNHFEKLGRRYGLLREFRENAIC
jgi:hypothetical protein